MQFGSQLSMVTHAAAVLGRAALDAVLPRQCLACRALVASDGALCSTCWAHLTFINEPCCASCGRPFAYDAGPDVLCGACLKRVPVFARARAAVIYDDASRRLILPFKHGDRTDAAPAFGLWMARAGKALLEDADIVAPVPLHWTRLVRRRYNQAALLAREVARRAERRMIPDLLLRRRRTRSLPGLGREARRQMVSGAFALHPRWVADVADRRILLIDDVLTTGATISGCATVLTAAGARAVDVLTLARVVRGEA